MTKEVIDDADKEGVKEYIGTGPFQFVEWKKDQYTHLEKFEDYKPVDEPADGLSGKKEALVDDIKFELVEDPSTRLAGMKSGKYDAGTNMNPDDFEDLNNDPNIETHSSAQGNNAMVYNTKEGPFSNQKMRQAADAVVDNEAVIKAAMGDEELYDSYPGYMEKDTFWYSE